MPQRSTSNIKSRIICVVAGFVLSVSFAAAYAMDPMDREMKMDMNRDRAESRIERLHEDQQLNQQRNKEPIKRKTVKRRPQNLKY